jgi:hypothetical protein
MHAKIAVIGILMPPTVWAHRAAFQVEWSAALSDAAFFPGWVGAALCFLTPNLAKSRPIRLPLRVATQALGTIPSWCASSFAMDDDFGCLYDDKAAPHRALRGVTAGDSGAAGLMALASDNWPGLLVT